LSQRAESRNSRKTLQIFSGDFRRFASPLNGLGIFHGRRIFRGLWGRAGAGEEIIIAKAAKPVAKLVPLSRTEVGRNAVWACWQAWPSFLRISMRRFPDL